MSDIDDLLAARAQGADTTTNGDIGALLAARASGATVAAPDAPKPKLPTPTAGSRFAQGITDLPTGLGQIAEHIAETPLNGIRSGIRSALTAAGRPETAALFAPVSTGDFDDIVQKREQDYQQARSDAQQNGIDWWRLGGQAANPVNYVVPGAGGALGKLVPAATTVAGRIGAGALQGAAVSAAQPTTTPGSFWYDKAKEAIAGFAAGGVASSVIEGAIPLIKAGLTAAKKAFGSSASAAASPAADATVNSALKAGGVDPSAVNVNVLAGLKAEAQNALEHGEAPSAQMVALRAKAESLPFPIRLFKGQLLGNEPGGPMQFAMEQNLRGIKGVGEPLTQGLVDQNSAAINNLDALGAKDALNTVEFGHRAAQTVQNFWDDIDAKKTALYNAVKNSRGQPAAMDQFTAMRQIRDTLDTPQASHAFDLLPANIQRTIGDLEDGKLPLTVGQMQALDKVWGAAANGTTDGSVRYAINTARRILNDAPIADDVGLEAKQAYQAAKQAHAQQMSMFDPKLQNGMPNPAFQPLVKAVIEDGKPPEGLFGTHFLNAAPSVAQKNLKFLGQLDPSLAPEVGNTLMGEIKREALSGASDERGTISQAVLSKYRQPVAAARMDALLQDPVRAGTFRNLADVIEAAKRHPTASAVNTSNTASAGVNAVASALKAQGLERLSGAIGKIPIVGPVLNAKEVSQGLAQSRLETQVQGAINPGVTLKSLLSATPAQAARRKLIGRAVIPAAASAEESSNDR